MPFDNFATYEGTRDALAGLSLEVSLLDSRRQVVFTHKYDGLDYSDFVWGWTVSPGKVVPAIRMLEGLPAGEYTLAVSVISGCKGLSAVPVLMVARQDADLYPLLGQFLLAGAVILALVSIVCSTTAYWFYFHRRRDGQDLEGHARQEALANSRRRSWPSGIEEIGRDRARPSRFKSCPILTTFHLPAAMPGTYAQARNFRHAGMETAAVWPVGDSRPVAGSMRKRTMESLSWFAASSQAPVGSMAKLRGHFPMVG